MSIHCPKCQSPVGPNAQACASCGLAVAKFENFKQDSRSDNLGEGWQHLEDNWESDDAHEAFMVLVAGSGDFRGGAARYRACERDSLRAERCRKMLDRIQSMATAAILSSKPKLADQHDEPFKKVVVLLLILVMLGAVAGFYFIFVKAKKKPSRWDIRTPAPRSTVPTTRPPKVTPAPKAVREDSP